jgi:hypothetical protein
MKMKNKKLIFIGIFVVALIGLAMFLNQFMFINPLETYSGDFLYEMKSCGGAGEFKNNSVDIEVLDNSIKFTQILSTYCNADKDNLKLEYNRQGNVLEINEIFKSVTVTKCVCPFEIIGTISNLEKGVYKIKFVFDNRYVNQKEVIDVLGFEIK